jgi:hypothetical protein
MILSCEGNSMSTMGFIFAPEKEILRERIVLDKEG